MIFKFNFLLLMRNGPDNLVAKNNIFYKLFKFIMKLGTY